MAPKSITVDLDADAVLARLEAAAGGIERAPLQNGTRVRLTMKGAAVALNVYPSKGGVTKVVFDRPASGEADEIAALLGGTASAPGKSKSAGTAIEPVLPQARAWIGSDESGKGDYFGPLVVAAVALTFDNWRVLQVLGVQDSKNLSDARASAMASQIRTALPNKVVVVGNRRYNELWQEMGSVNRLLAWAHARAIEDALELAPEATAAVADQFGDESLIRNALMRKGRTVELVQMPRAERDPAVAAASILARAEFLRRLDALSGETGVRLPKGASPAVEATARALVHQRGRGVLQDIAKVHFKTTKKL
ncbi:MAG TPA: ribonuclease HIII [Dehalococcoidia bacterium]|nr:ribonuclease HIII [Dehalococcoidia bacterium]